MKVSLITVSYGPDLARCRRLCESVVRFVDDSIEHVVVVPRRDLPLFEGVGAPGRTRVMAVESVLPGWIRRVPGLTKWWWTTQSLPVRGWIMQQVTKLAMHTALDSDVIVMVDSDVAFIRPFGAGHVVRDDQVRFHRLPGPIPAEVFKRYHRKAGELLGIPVRDDYGSDYVAQVLPWRRDVVERLVRRVESVAGRDWRTVLCRTRHFSEGILYGVFVEYVLKEQAGHYWDDVDLCHCSWHHRVEGVEGAKRFIREAPEHCVAVLVQSNLGIDPAGYDAVLREVWDSNDREGGRARA